MAANAIFSFFESLIALPSEEIGLSCYTESLVFGINQWYYGYFHCVWIGGRTMRNIYVTKTFITFDAKIESNPGG
ncbi:hypothetical protein BXY57_0006 [Thermoflavifilum aggregans]|uniref:Uncharacterized protein n=1 Tax=Thermoflavifilum aggregans TaxID=454188 RepID=A0A2M9CRJ4_9BACT|nr:hypothetical protein [Thermoflavifilum aggregans]PJJ74448.1 hypothetical protein BXY57_0006 [Thermoflavifilum aggregans]